MSPALNVERLTDIASEYKTAYQQLQHVQKKEAEAVAAFERDHALARSRYRAALKEFTEFALGEGDEFIEELDGEPDAEVGL